MMRSDRKPPLAIGVRPRRVLRSNSNALQSPPDESSQASLCTKEERSLTKSQKPIRSWHVEESDLRPEYGSFSFEVRAPEKMVQDGFGDGGFFGGTTNWSPVSMFERGRFYEEYSARRNERLSRKKKIETGESMKTPYSLGVTVELSKKSDSSRKLESLRKSVSAAYSVERSEPRYMLRSMSKSKDNNKKPPLPLYSERSTAMMTVNGCSERRMGTRRAKKI